jgi:transposase-like protein
VETAVRDPVRGHEDGVAFQVFDINHRLAPRVDPGGHAVMTRRYQVLPPTASVPAPDDPLEELARLGAQKMLEQALSEEVDAYLGRRRYARGAQTGYRNGYLPERTIGTASAAITIRQPRVSDVPKDAEPFHSEIVRRWQRQSRTQQRLFVRLYLEGLSSGDFEPVFRALVRQTVALSPSSVLRLRQEWEQEYRAWQARAIAERYVYLFADGLYLKAGIEREHSVMLVVIGVTAEGRKDLLAMRLGYRESAESWAEVLRDLRDRGMSEAPLLGIGDGALGFWAALAEVYPTTKHQRCWNHRRLNVIDKLPKRLHAQAKRAITGMSEAPTGRNALGSGSPTALSCGHRGIPTPLPAWNGTGMTSSPSTTSPRSTGLICGPVTRSSRCSAGCGSGPTRPNGCRCVRTPLTWSSSS